MVKVTDCTCCDCDCDDAQLRETIKERALSSVNKIYTFDHRTYWPDGTGMVTIPLPTQEQLDKIEDVATLSEQVDKNTAGLNTANELIAGEQTQIDSLKTTLETSYQAIVQKGSANGYAGLDNNARVPLAQLYAGTSANQVPLIGKQLLANEMLVVDADGLTVRSKPIVQTLSFRGIYPSKTALPSEGNVSGDYAIVSDGTAQDDTGYYVWGYNTATSEYEWVWTILFDANNYQLISNLVTEISDSSDDSHYPSAKAVKDYHDASVGTIEQEITDINNDLATVQTTIGEHTTGIANAITQAQAAYDDATIADNVLTLKKGNGETTEITLPSRTVLDMSKIGDYLEVTGTKLTIGSYTSRIRLNLYYSSYLDPTMMTVNGIKTISINNTQITYSSSSMSCYGVPTKTVIEHILDINELTIDDLIKNMSDGYYLPLIAIGHNSSPYSIAYVVGDNKYGDVASVIQILNGEIKYPSNSYIAFIGLSSATFKLNNYGSIIGFIPYPGYA